MSDFKKPESMKRDLFISDRIYYILETHNYINDFILQEKESPCDSLFLFDWCG